HVGREQRLAARPLVTVDPRHRLSNRLPWAGRPLVDRRILVDDHPLLGVAALDLLLGADQSRHVRTASSILGYVPQRHRLPAMACRMRSGVGSGSASTKAAADTIWPGVQNPHWSASARTNASTSGW